MGRRCIHDFARCFACGFMCFEGNFIVRLLVGIGCKTGHLIFAIGMNGLGQVTEVEGLDIRKSRSAAHRKSRASL